MSEAPARGVPTSPTLGTSPTTRAPQTECDAQSYQYLIGHPVPQGFQVAGPLRVFASDEPVTMDYNPARLNLELDPQTRNVIAVRCG